LTTSRPPRRIIWCRLGLQEYRPAWQAMQRFTERRGPDTPDEIRTLQHPPVFTLGQAGRHEHILDSGDIPVIRSDRGGQVTYHGPGQIIAYLLFDLRRAGIGVKTLVRRLEQAVIDLLSDYAIRAEPMAGAPGVYVGGRKIASLGLRVRRGCSFHGLSLNCDLELEPFRRINPCGHPGLEVTRMADLTPISSLEEVERALVQRIAERLGGEVEVAKKPG
jgi:lipoyl(octanoyl) transferase